MPVPAMMARSGCSFNYPATFASPSRATNGAIELVMEERRRRLDRVPDGAFLAASMTDDADAVDSQQRRPTIFTVVVAGPDALERAVEFRLGH